MPLADQNSPQTGSLLQMTKQAVKDASGRLNDDDYQAAISRALKKYSAQKPNEVTVELSGAGSHDIALPDTWEDEFSLIVQLEYPVGQIPENLVDPSDDVWIYQTPSGKLLRLRDYAPAATDKLWLTHTVSRTEETIVANDLDAVSFLAAAHALRLLANRYLDTTDPLIAADVVNYRSKSDEAERRAKAMEKLYLDHMGVKEDEGEPAASQVGDLDLKYPGGFDRLTHPRRMEERR